MFSGGLRATAYASYLAAPRMIEARNGLIVNITWVLDRPHGHAFYEVVKNGTNKLTEQMADDLRHEVACVAVSPGFMRLERMNLNPEEAAMTESAEFAGRAVAALAADDDVLAKSGSVLTTPALARVYGFTDVDGSQQSPFWDSHWARPRLSGTHAPVTGLRDRRQSAGSSSARPAATHTIIQACPYASTAADPPRRPPGSPNKDQEDQPWCAQAPIKAGTAASPSPEPNPLTNYGPK